MAEFHGRSLEHPMLGKHSAGLQDLNMSFQALLLEKIFYLETSPISPARVLVGHRWGIRSQSFVVLVM